jgi:16S rRNA G1207 methylase RsmC
VRRGHGIGAKNSFEGNVIARTQGRYLIVVVNPPQNGAEILTKTAQSLIRTSGSQ